MERSAIRDSAIHTREPRITLRSIRATNNSLLSFVTAVQKIQPCVCRIARWRMAAHVPV